MAISLAHLPCTKVRVQKWRQGFKVDPQFAPGRHGCRNVDVQHWPERRLEIKGVSEPSRGGPSEAYEGPVRGAQLSIPVAHRWFVFARPGKRKNCQPENSNSGVRRSGVKDGETSSPVGG